MNSIIQYFLPHSQFTYEQDPHHPLTFTTVKLRPLTSSFFIVGKEITLHLNQTTQMIVGKRLTLFTKHQTKIEAYGISYIIHKKINLSKLVVSIGCFTCVLENVTIEFKSPTTISIQSIQIQNFVTIQRFDRHIPTQIKIMSSQLFTIRLPEIRIFSTPSISVLNNWKQSITKWIPKEEGDDPLPEIHISSIFIRYIPRKWFRCIQPISIGNNFKNIWEIWEHLVRAITRI